VIVRIAAAVEQELGISLVALFHVWPAGGS
jgi:hypothetical protein